MSELPRSPRYWPFVRLLGLLTMPLRMLAILCFFVGGAASLAGLGTMLRLWAVALGLVLVARTLTILRWPPLPRYVRVCAADLQPRHWQPNYESAPTYVAWAAARPGLERWCSAHQRGLYRALRVGAPWREFARHRVSDYVSACEALAARLSHDEVTTLRRTGQLPTWFWTSLATDSSS